MEASCSPIEETAMDITVVPSRSKSKTALNRRPSGYWKVFSNWWRGRYAALKTRPTVNEVIEWYHRNAASSWPAGQVPCLKAVLRQSKGLRPIDGLKEYFREYRKKRKQQGGLALKAGEDASQRRSRPVKRRRGRTAHKDSSDEEDGDELEQEASACSDQRSSDDEEDEEVEEAMPPRRQRGCAASRRAAAVDIEEPQVMAAAADDGGGAAAQAVFDAWQHVVSGVGAGGGAALEALEDCPSEQLAVAAVVPAGLTCVTAVGMDEADAVYLQVPHALAAASGDPVHPAVAHGMVPVASSDSPRAASMPAHAPIFAGACLAAAPPYGLYIQAVAAVRRPSSRLAASRRCGAPAALPPLSSVSTSPLAAAAARAVVATAPGDALAKLSPKAAKAEPGAIKLESGAQHDDDHAGDRCSTGGGVPGPCDARFARPTFMHERAFDGYDYEYMYGPPPPYACHPPHPCCYRPSPYPIAYPYRAVSSASYPPGPDCSTGGGATSSFSPAAPWTATDGGAAFPQRQCSVESSAQMDACYPHPHAHHPHPHQPAAWGPWGPADGGAPWQGVPPHYAHDPAWGRGMGRMQPSCAYVPGMAPPMGCACPCGACPGAMRLHGSSSSPCQQQPQGMRPPPHIGFVAYGTRHGGMPAYPARPADVWAGGVPAGREPHPPQSEVPVEGEACSSSVSEHEGHDAGRRSPCSDTSGQGSAQPAKPCTSPTAPDQPQHWLRYPASQLQLPMLRNLGHGHHHHAHHPPGCYPVVMYPTARGMATAGSVTSMASLVPMPEAAFMTAAAAAGACRAAGGSFAGAVRRGNLAAAIPVVQDAAAACHADVSPYLADAPAAPCGSEAVEKEAEPSLLSGPTEPQGPGLEAAECGLGLADGFGSAAREAMDHDLAFAFENFMACDAAFDALACQ